VEKMSFELTSKTALCKSHGEYESKAMVIGGVPRMWSSCPACGREQDAIDAEARRVAEEKAKQARIERQLSQAGIPLRFRNRSFENFTADTKGKAHAKTAAVEFSDDFAQRYRDGSAMVFSGLPGTGKSHLSIAICQAVMKAGYTAMYMNAFDAIRLVRSTWARNSEKTEAEVMRSLSSVDLLALDEVGAQYGTEGEQVILFDIINRRYQDQLPMILMTNQGKEGFRQYLGDRAFDRLREGGKWVAFDWESHRGK